MDSLFSVQTLLVWRAALTVNPVRDSSDSDHSQGENEDTYDCNTKTSNLEGSDVASSEPEVFIWDDSRAKS